MTQRSPDLPPPFPLLTRRLAHIISVLLAVALLSACATTAPVAQDPDYLYLQTDRYVRLVPRAPDAADNDHPFDISAESLKAGLSGLQANGIITLADRIEVFTGDELNEMAPHLAKALSRATPDQDITFQSRGMRGTFGKYSPSSFTSGRIFARDGRLNIILGVLHSRYDPDAIVRKYEFFPSGTRAARIEKDWTILAGAGEVVDGRGDWVRLDLSQLDAPATPVLEPVVEPAMPGAATAPEPARQSPIDERSRQIESKLKVLQDLKTKGLISDEEYREQRKAILRDI